MIIISATLKDNKVEKKIQEIGSNDGLGMFLANETYRAMIPFIPMDTGMLYQNVIIQPFRITFTQPYAKRVYEGENLHFNREKHRNATHHWDRPTQIVKGREIANAVNRYQRRRG